MRIQLTEDGDDTSARAALTTDDGIEVTGAGRARRNPSDPAVPEIGDELAAARALADLAESLAVSARRDIAGSADSPAQNRSW
ncbi:dsRBD fold-containing protein [Nonomuraea basaltis]|uniref:dsRBD fold-containing protein n=1 Tax=Nonomuraea basaltis TaxID=2495887 RepID=UPI0030B82886